MIHYAITDPKYYTQNPHTFVTKIDEVLQKNRVDFFCYRDKENSDYEALARLFISNVNILPQTKAILHSHVDLAYKLGAYGVHLPSSALDEIVRAKALNLYVIVSTHSEEEAQKAAHLGADAVTFSPIFDTPNKGKAKGLEALKEIVDKITINVVALGGITTQEQLIKVEQTGAFGFASIRYFI